MNGQEILIYVPSYSLIAATPMTFLLKYNLPFSDNSLLAIASRSLNICLIPEALVDSMIRVDSSVPSV